MPLLPNKSIKFDTSKTRFLIKSNKFHLFSVEANNEALISGRGSEENPPSKIMDGISKLISELTEILSQGISNFFRDSKEDDKIIELKEEGNEEEEEDEVKSRHLEGTHFYN